VRGRRQSEQLLLRPARALQSAMEVECACLDLGAWGDVSVVDSVMGSFLIFGVKTLRIDDLLWSYMVIIAAL
jgi:hypothetical protein